MKKVQISILLIGLVFGHLSFADAQIWFGEHPEALQKVIADCPHKQPKNISCKKLQEIGLRLNNFIFKFQTDAQNYGQDILNLQNKIVLEEEELTKSPESDALKLAIEKDKMEVGERLAIVRWLASPEA